MTTASRAQLDQELAQGKRRRKRQEAILALLFVAPATIITFMFGIWPVIFGFFVSLHQWRARSHSFLGLDQYVRALGNVAYVLAFLLCILFLYGAYNAVRKIATELDDLGAHGVAVPVVPFAAAALVLAVGTIAFAVGFAAQTSDVLLIGLVLLAAGALIYRWAFRREGGHPVGRLGVDLWQAWLFVILGVGLFLFTVAEITGDSSLPFQIARKLAPTLYLPALEEQMPRPPCWVGAGRHLGTAPGAARLADDYAARRCIPSALALVRCDRGRRAVIYLISAFSLTRPRPARWVFMAQRRRGDRAERTPPGAQRYRSLYGT
jgi:fumarate reductase subunit D